MKLTIYPHLKLELRKSGAIPSIPHTLSWNWNKIIDLLCHFNTDTLIVCHLFINLPKAAATKSHGGQNVER